MSSLDQDQQESPALWRSLADRDGEIPASDDEMPAGADQLTAGTSRRRFMQIMGASTALAGAGGGCRWEKEEIVPLAERPDDYIPGVPKRYASAAEIGGVAAGLLITAFDGRPIKTDGNPEHPDTGGASTAFAQASVLGLYDPDRSRSVRKRDGAGNWDDLLTLFHGGLAAAGGAGLRILSESTSSPTVAALRAMLATALPRARWHEYEPLSNDNERLGTKMAFGKALRPIADLSRAQTIVALDADILGEHPAMLRHARGFARGRRASTGRMNRLYAIESSFSGTGAIADHRLPLRSELITPLLMALDATLGSGAPPASEFLKEPKVAKFVGALVKDLQASRGRAVLMVGRNQPPVAHALVAKLNLVLGAAGGAMRYVELPDGNRPSHMEDIARLAADMKSGQVKSLLILGGNPVYNAPADIDFTAGLAKVETSIHLSEYYDETARAATWHVPRAHYLESWGDVRSHDGTTSVAQPVIEPLWGGKSVIEMLALVLRVEHKSAESLVRDTFDKTNGGGREAWRKALHDGFIANSAYPNATPARANFGVPPLAPTQNQGTRLKNGEIEVVFTASSHTYDGRYANNAWLQELPNFLTKVTWDNCALVSPATADELGIKNDTFITIDVGGRSLRIPAYVMPGQARHSIAVALGHGREHAGMVGGSKDEGVSAAGFNAYTLRTAKAAYLVSGATLKPTGKSFKLAGVQDHWDYSDSQGRKGVKQRLPNLIQERSLTDYRQSPRTKPAHRDPSMPELADKKSLWAEHKYTGHKWGMATDLGKCTGCNSCMVACQAENNIAVVGKADVKLSREMHWIRIDRYFAGDPDDPRIAHQPVACQHCEMAPCEQVCPVGATLHTEEGLNDMIYNRCIGTRYCLNNCPYKVRRFNFFHYQEAPEKDPVRRLLFNPEVTVRSRGVMEKCTFCVQRIQNAKIFAKNDRRELKDGDIRTACQDACPTNAIVFGDLNDPKSEVSKLHAEPRAYELLHEFNVKPRNMYLARIRNPNPELG